MGTNWLLIISSDRVFTPPYFAGTSIVVGARKQSKRSQHRERQYNLAVFVSFVRPSKEVANTPDEIRELSVRLDSHGSLASGDSAEGPGDAAKNNFRAIADRKIDQDNGIEADQRSSESFGILWA